jgi:hypothetical protein
VPLSPPTVATESLARPAESQYRESSLRVKEYREVGHR